MIEFIGWVSTALVLLGYISNAKGYPMFAMIAWIIGDIGWVSYDLYINNISHLVLSFVIISINLYGIIRILHNKEITQ
jgi:hypothetical protein